MTSQNVIFSAPKIVEVRPEPLAPLEDNQFRLRALHSLVSSGTECIALNGDFQPGSHWANYVKFPFRAGYCMVGEVEEIGPQVENFAVGQRVAARVPHAQVQNVADMPGTRCVLVPDGVSSEDAAWFGMATIAQNGVRRAGHELGDNVVIIGAGIFGQLVTQYLRAFGAREIIVIDPATARLELATNHGASRTLESLDDAKTAVREWTQNRGADVVYDATGHPAVFAPALGLARDFGTLLLLGDSPYPSQQCLTSDVMTRGVQIVAAHDNNAPRIGTSRDPWTHAAMSQVFFSYLQSGQMRVSDLVTHRFTPQNAPECYEMLLRDRSKALGVLFDWTDF